MLEEIGIDILEIEHFKKSLKAGGKKFLELVFTEKELEYARNKRGLENLATAFAAKEAVFKTLNLPAEKRADFREIEVARLPCGKPQIILLGRLAQIFPKNKFQILLSLSCTSKIAIAVAVLKKIRP